MGARHRAFARLVRHVPEVHAVDQRPVARAVTDRDVAPPPGPRMGGESVKVRDQVHERALRGPNAGPNAPLLIRLVRHPYGLQVAYPGKRPGTARPDLKGLRPERASGELQAALAESHVSVGGSRPERLRAEPVPHPVRRPEEPAADGVTLAIAPELVVARRRA